MSLRLPLLAAALVALAATCHAAQAQEIASFVVSDDDGYGVDACLEGGDTSCGRAVAAAWCEANGYSQAVGFRPSAATDVTGSIKGPTLVAASEPHSVVITCQK